LLEFSTIAKAWDTLFQMQLGGIEYTTLADAHSGEEDAVLRNLGLLYYYSFMALVFFILVNVLLGILIEAFVAVQEAARQRSSHQLKIHEGSLLANLSDMVHEWWDTSVTLTLRTLRCLGLGTPRDSQIHRWSEEKWLEVIDAVVDAKKENRATLRSGNMLSLITAMNMTPQCQGLHGKELFYQVKMRFMKSEYPRGFGQIWPRDYDESGVSSLRISRAKEQCRPPADSSPQESADLKKVLHQQELLLRNSDVTAAVLMQHEDTHNRLLRALEEVLQRGRDSNGQEGNGQPKPNDQGTNGGHVGILQASGDAISKVINDVGSIISPRSNLPQIPDPPDVLGGIHLDEGVQRMSL